MNVGLDDRLSKLIKFCFLLLSDYNQNVVEIKYLYKSLTRSFVNRILLKIVSLTGDSNCRRRAIQKNEVIRSLDLFIAGHLPYKYGHVESFQSSK